jgi:hypothetical protein
MTSIKTLQQTGKRKGTQPIVFGTTLALEWRGGVLVEHGVFGAGKREGVVGRCRRVARSIKQGGLERGTTRRSGVGFF